MTTNQIISEVVHGKTTFTAQLTTFGGRSDATPVLQLQAGARGRFRSIYRDELHAILGDAKTFQKMLDAMDAATAQQAAPKVEAPKVEAPTVEAPTVAMPAMPAMPAEMLAMFAQFISSQGGAPSNEASAAAQPAKQAKTPAKSASTMGDRVKAQLNR